MSAIVKFSSSNPHPHGRRIGRTLVCGCFFPSSNIPLIHHFFLLLLFRILIFMFWAASLSSFVAASPSEEKEIVVSTNSKSSSNTNTTSTRPISPAATFSNSTTSISHTSSHKRHALPSPLDHLQVAVGVSLSALFFAVMALFTCFRFIKLRRRKHYYLERVQEKGIIIHPNPNPNPNDGIGNGTNIIRFTWDEMERFTSNFSSVIGSGGFSTVYLAQFRDSTLGAIKIHSSSSERLNRVYKQELEILLGLRHDNIVKLLGYCDDREEGVLVFEYAPNGNLQEKLHSGSTAGASVLSWKSRIKIAFQLAQALEYLHDNCPLQIVHGDIKASNILLDQQLNCKLCDFGSAKMGFSSTVLPPSSSAMNNKMMMLGSPGYTDPHYLRTGIASKKNDVYSFGVIVLELITGREALCSRTGERLTSVAGPVLSDASKVSQLVDARLLLRLQEDKFNGGSDLLEEVKAMASISATCLSDSPTLRPSASDIVNAMRSKIPSTLSFSFSTSENKF